MSEPSTMAVDNGSKIVVEAIQDYVDLEVDDYGSSDDRATGVRLTPAEARALAHILTDHAAAAEA